MVHLGHRSENPANNHSPGSKPPPIDGKDWEVVPGEGEVAEGARLAVPEADRGERKAMGRGAMSLAMNLWLAPAVQPSS